MTHYHPPPYHIPATYYPQIEQQRSGFALAYEPGFIPGSVVGGATGLDTSGPRNGTVGVRHEEGKQGMAGDAKPVAAKRSRRKKPSTNTPETIKTDPTARPMMNPAAEVPTLTLPAPTSAGQSLTSASIQPVIAKDTAQREHAVEQYIVLELRREKERKRKADYRARKRREALGLPAETPGLVEGSGAEGRIGEEEMDEDADDDEPQFPESSTSLAQDMYQQQPHQQTSFDQQWMRGSPPYSGRASSAPVGKVQVRVGDRIVAIELEQVEKIIREQHALQQAQQQAMNAADLESMSSTSSAPEPLRHHGQPVNPHGPSATIEDDRIALEAYMATASRDVPLPNGMMGMMHVDMMGYNGHNQNEHDMSSITLANGYAAYASQPPSATSGSFGPLPHIYADNGHPSPQVTAGTVPIPKQARQLTNWFQPILWTLIDETAEKFGFGKAPLIARHLRETVSPRIFGRLGERQVRKWINPEKTGWKTSVLEKVRRQELLANVQAGLITIPSGNGAVNGGDGSMGSMSALGDRASKGVAETKPPTKTSRPKEQKRGLHDAPNEGLKLEEQGERKKKRRKKNSSNGALTTAENAQKHIQMSPTLALDPALL